MKVSERMSAHLRGLTEELTRLGEPVELTEWEVNAWAQAAKRGLAPGKLAREIAQHRDAERAMVRERTNG